jgi:hypothetical protein
VKDTPAEDEQKPAKDEPKKTTKRKTVSTKEPKAKKQKPEKESAAEKDVEIATEKEIEKEKEEKAAADFRIMVPFITQLTDVLTMGSGEVGQLGLQSIRVDSTLYFCLFFELQ